MGDFPDGIMETARAVRQRCVWASNESVKLVAEAILAAVLAERERCATLVATESERLFALQDGKDEAVDSNLRLIGAVMSDVPARIRCAP